MRLNALPSLLLGERVNLGCVPAQTASGQSITLPAEASISQQHHGYFALDRHNRKSSHRIQ